MHVYSMTLSSVFFCCQDGEVLYTDWKLAKDDSGHLQSEYSVTTQLSSLLSNI